MAIGLAAAMALSTGCGHHRSSKITGPPPGSVPWYQLDVCSGTGEYVLKS